MKSRMPEIVEPKQLIQSRVLVKRARLTVKRGAARPNGKSKPPQSPLRRAELDQELLDPSERGRRIERRKLERICTIEVGSERREQMPPVSFFFLLYAAWVRSRANRCHRYPSKGWRRKHNSTTHCTCTGESGSSTSTSCTRCLGYGDSYCDWYLTSALVFFWLVAAWVKSRAERPSVSGVNRQLHVQIGCKLGIRNRKDELTKQAKRNELQINPKVIKGVNACRKRTRSS